MDADGDPDAPKPDDFSEYLDAGSALAVLQDDGELLEKSAGISQRRDMFLKHSVIMGWIRL